MFRELLSRLQTFNIEIAEANNTRIAIPNAAYRMNCYKNLHRQLREVIFTKQRQIQKEFLRKVYAQYMD